MEWAAFAARVLAGAAGDGAEPGDDRAGVRGLIPVVEPFARAAAEVARWEIGREVGHSIEPGSGGGSELDVDAVAAGFREALAVRLARLAARTLVLELNTARVSGRLGAADAERRFAEFVRAASGRAGLAMLQRRYPVLIRLLAQTCLGRAAALAELVRRFRADRPELVRVLLHGVDPGPLLAVDGFAGDGHRGGRAVAVLRFADAALVYKPRPVGVHRVFNEVAQWCNSRLAPWDLRTLGVVERAGYGWTEFVAPEGTDPDGLDRFYHRHGVLLALLYVLDGTDIHFENVIAHRDHPVLVDVETLFHPRFGRSPDPAAAALAESVYRTMLLPRMVVGDDSVLDISGLGGERAGRWPLAAPDWAGAGTDRMRLVRRPPGFAGAANRPSLAGTKADATKTEAEPGRYAEAVVEGFGAAYDLIQGSQSAWIGPGGLLGRFAEHEVRVLIRDTAAYAVLLDESTHPDLMREEERYHRTFRELREQLGLTVALGEPADDDLADDELAELLAGDIPVFTARPGSADLWSGPGRRRPDALAETGLAAAERRVRALSRADRDRQEWIIRSALAARSPDPPHRFRAGPPAAPPSAAGPKHLLTAARDIGDRLLAQACRAAADERAASEERINWLGLELLADRFPHFGPLGASLGTGYCGVALFLAQLAAVTGDADYARAARQAVRPLPGLLARLADRPDRLAAIGSGAWAGLGGISYGLAHIGALISELEFAEAAILATDLAARAAADETEHGVHGGTAGGLAALLAVHQTTGSAQAWDAATACADRLVTSQVMADQAGAGADHIAPDHPDPAAAASAHATRHQPHHHPEPSDPTPPTGFSHGPAGIGWALTRFADAGGGSRYAEAGLTALRRAVAQHTDAPGTDPSWCRGLAGVALAVADCPRAQTDPDLSGFLAAAVHRVRELPAPADPGLCHGGSGVLELLAAMGESVDGYAGRLLAAAEASDGAPAASPGLLSGLSGLGHGLLRAGFGKLVAPVLLLRLPGG